VRDGDLKELAGMNLTDLHIPSSAQTDLGLAHYLAAMRPPDVLQLGFWKISDSGLKVLAGQKQLRVLDLSGAHVTDAGLKALAGLKELQVLDLTATGVTDAGLKGLAGLSQLWLLKLVGTRVSDSGLSQLAALPKLQRVDLTDTLVTDAGAAELKKKLPGVDLRGDFQNRADTGLERDVRPRPGARARMGASKRVERFRERFSSRSQDTRAANSKWQPDVGVRALLFAADR